MDKISQQEHLLSYGTVNRILDELNGEDPDDWDKREYLGNSYISRDAIATVKTVPSAQPSATDTNVGGTNDTISRQALLDAVDGVPWYHQNQHGEMVHGANPDEHQAWYKADDIYAAIDSAPSAQPVEDVRAMCGECDAWNQYKNPQPGWIPVTERLPENNNDVLVTDGTDCAVAYWRTDAQAWDDSMHGWCDLYGLEVTAWMPLPTPYREGRQDDH